MSQFEYNDLNKFFVSMGVFLVGLTFILPWLFLRENFDLLVKVKELNELTPSARLIIENRQLLIGTYSYVIPVISIVSFILGAFLIFKGVKKWRKVQFVLEERHELDNKKISAEIVKLTEKEKLEKVSKDIQFSKEGHSQIESKITYFGLAQQYLKVERKFADLVRRAIEDKYKICQDFRIESNEVDLLLAAPLAFERDMIFEVKYSSSRVGGQYFHQSLQKLKKSLDYYRQKIKSKTDGRLIFVMPYKALTEKSKQPESLYDDTLSLIDKANKENRREGINVCYIDYDKLETYTSEEIISILGL